MTFIILTRAKQFAQAAHADQRYGEHPFTYHLAAVEAQLRKFKHADPQLLAAAWLHDVVEDTPTTLDELELEFGPRVRMYVDAVTDRGAKGTQNRETRQRLTYANLRELAAVYGDPVVNLKLADRLANLEASLTGAAGMEHLSMYLTEHPFFCRQVGSAGGDERMWKALDRVVRRGWKVYQAQT